MNRNIQIFVVAAIVVGVISGIGYYAIPEIEKFQQKNEVRLSVQETIGSFNGTLDSVVLTEGKYYSFVVDEKLEKILLHPREELIDTMPKGLTNANISIEKMNERLSDQGETWINYEFYNPITGNVDPKTTYLVSHEGYVFGAGFYSP